MQTISWLATGFPNEAGEVALCVPTDRSRSARDCSSPEACGLFYPTSPRRSRNRGAAKPMKTRCFNGRRR